MSDSSISSNFNGMVTLYERGAEPLTCAIAAQVLRQLDPERGRRMIDVATGPGGIAVEAARRGFHVLATDISPAMVCRAQERLATYEDSRALEMSYDGLDVEEASFDVATSFFGTLLFPAWKKGLHELARVVRRDGQVVVSAFTEDRDASPALLFKRTFEECFPGREFWPDDFFPHHSADSLIEAMRGVGFGGTQVAVIEAQWSPVDDQGRPVPPSEVLENSDAMLRNFPGYRDLSDDERAELRKWTASAVTEYLDAEGIIRMPVRAYAAQGRRV